MERNHIVEEFAAAIEGDPNLDEAAKGQVLRNLARLRKTRVNLLVVGSTGSGKSSTINALFNARHAIVGVGADPETMEIGRYDYDNVTLYDSPGFGDTEKKDKLHAEKVTETLKKKNEDGSQLIDFVLVVVDGSTKDLGTTFDVINKVILPHIGLDKDRILVAMNQADMAMKGTYWNPATNRPEPELEAFLDTKIASIKSRIEEATGVAIEPIYYAAGYTDRKSGRQNPSYNLSKLLLYILKAVKEEKRMAIAQDLSKEKTSWHADDGRTDYKKEIKETLWQAVFHDCKQLGESAKELIKAGWAKLKGWF